MVICATTTSAVGGRFHLFSAERRGASEIGRYNSRKEKRVSERGKETFLLRLGKEGCCLMSTEKGGYRGSVINKKKTKKNERGNT